MFTECSCAMRIHFFAIFNDGLSYKYFEVLFKKNYLKCFIFPFFQSNNYEGNYEGGGEEHGHWFQVDFNLSPGSGYTNCVT